MQLKMVHDPVLQCYYVVSGDAMVTLRPNGGTFFESKSLLQEALKRSGLKLDNHNKVIIDEKSDGHGRVC